MIMKSVSIPGRGAEQRLIYKVVGDKELEMIYYGPKVRTEVPAPIYLTITGGGWHSGSADSMVGFSRQSIDYALEHGYAVASPMYRLSGEGVNMRQIISDCMDSCRYLAHFKKELGVDPERIVTSGHSAGGHLALLLALAPHGLFTEQSLYDDDFSVIATAPMSPPTVLYTKGVPQTLAFSVSEIFPQMTEEDFQDTSPIKYINAQSCPCLTIAGDKDNLVFPVSSEILVERYREVGAPAEIVFSHNGGHCFECMVPGAVSSPDFNQVQQILIEFLNRFI